MAVAMRYLADDESARDVLQDSFVKILTSVGRFSFRGEGSLRAWVLRIVANESLDYLRRERRLHFVEDLPDDLPDEEPDVGIISQAVLQHMIEQLPAGYRTVLNLFVFEQKSHREIAQVLGIKESSSASQFLRAKKLLAQMIKNYQKQQST